MTMSLLCETVTGHSMAELLRARDAAEGADMVELRLDGIADLDVDRALLGRRHPVVVTCRPGWEGGRFSGSEEARLRILARALELGVEFADVEWRALPGSPGGPSGSTDVGFGDLVRRHPDRIVVSAHEFEGVPGDLPARARAMRRTGARTIKLAVAVTRLADTLALVDVAREGPAIVVAMGDAGTPSRLLATRYGSRWTYGGPAVAPGQIPVARMLREFRFRSVTPVTRLFGVVSVTAMHSLSPVMHNAAFEAAGIDAVYVPLQAADFDDFLCYAATMGIEGASVTIPFKRDAFAAAARADARVHRVGAANTLRQLPAARTGDSAGDAGASRPDGAAWEARNTDVAGFLAPLEAAFPTPLRDVRVAVLGAGGAARAAIVALQSRGARVTLHARRREQARDTAQALEVTTGGWPPPAGSWDLLVNCTPLGGAGLRAESPLPGGPFDGRFVYDLTYGPGESALLREARQAGCLTLDGLPMLIAQAERQWEWWIGQPPPAGVMEKAAKRQLAGADAPGAPGIQNAET